MLTLFLMTSVMKAKVSVTLSEDQIANAQTILLRLHADAKEPRIGKIYAAFGGKRYPFYRNRFAKGRDFYALVPASYYAKPGERKLVVVYIEKGQKHYRSFPVEIYEGDYETEKLRVAPSRAHISAKNLKRIARERREAMHIYRTSTPKLYIKAPLDLPLKSKITSRFGNKRLFNGVLKSYHSGTDFRAKTGTPIHAVANGRVVLTKKRFFAGNSVIIDHGQGIYTCYYHLSRFRVKAGERVKRGDVIGLAGATGRVTGPHLHYSVRVNGVQVDPIQFTRTVDLLFQK
jgi:murein DD-endopeptidase MepM/ murein hydrolase activator NlpD